MDDEAPRKKPAEEEVLEDLYRMGTLNREQAYTIETKGSPHGNDQTDASDG